MDEKFQPTRPLRGATVDVYHMINILRYFNPRAPCGARLATVKCARGKRDFNPRAPCGARPDLCTVSVRSTKFQPTRPLRGATAGFPVVPKC